MYALVSIGVVVSQRGFKIRGTSVNNPLADKPL
jgi:hypothetical protein